MHAVLLKFLGWRRVRQLVKDFGFDIPLGVIHGEHCSECRISLPPNRLKYVKGRNVWVFYHKSKDVSRTERTGMTLGENVNYNVATDRHVGNKKRWLAFIRVKKPWEMGGETCYVCLRCLVEQASFANDLWERRFWDCTLSQTNGLLPSRDIMVGRDRLPRDFYDSTSDLNQHMDS